MKRVRLLSAAFIALCAAALLAACAAGTPGKAGSEQKGLDPGSGISDKDKKISIAFWTYPRWKGVTGNEADGREGDWERYVIENFRKEHPGVEIDFKTLVYDGGPQKVNVAIASGEQPDILRDYPGRHQDYAQRGLLAELDGYITEAERAQYLQGVYEQCVGVDGKQYMIPWGITTKFLMVNRDIFRRAGAESLLPQNDDRTWTYGQFKKALEAVNNPEEGIFGLGLYAGNEQADNGTVALLENFGVDLIGYGADGKPFTPVNTEKGVKAAEFLRSLVDEKLVFPEAESLKSADCEKLFALGKIAILPFGSSYITTNAKTRMEQGKVEKFEIYPVMFPNAEGVKPHYFGELDTYAVFKSGDGEREKWAVDFCKYITGPKYINDLKPSRNFPAYTYADDLYAGDEFMAYAKRIFEFNKDYYNNVRGFWRIRSVIYPAFKELYALPEKSPEQVLDDLARNIQNILDENYK